MSLRVYGTIFASKIFSDSDLVLIRSDLYFYFQLENIHKYKNSALKRSSMYRYQIYIFQFKLHPDANLIFKEFITLNNVWH